MLKKIRAYLEVRFFEKLQTIDPILKNYEDFSNKMKAGWIITTGTNFNVFSSSHRRRMTNGVRTAVTMTYIEMMKGGMVRMNTTPLYEDDEESSVAIDKRTLN